jgi:hypothetical protein
LKMPELWMASVSEAGTRQDRLRTDLPYFAAECLKLRSKSGELKPFIFNPAQMELHRRLEEQHAKTGRVRVVVLKARQLGISSYLAARFFWKTIGTPGLRTFILAHEKRASANLFEIVKRFYDGLPPEERPSVGTSNAESLVFDRLDSGYIVSVATPDGAGRSSTCQLLHASEAAFWVDLEVQAASLFQIVPDLPGTEIAIETTANGFNSFHQMWRLAEAGESEFMPVFLAWSLDPAYRKPVDPDFQLTAEENKLKELHRLDDEQICWLRSKQMQLGERVHQEFPIEASAAFISSSFDSFIPAELVIRARREKAEAYGPLIIGCDPAGLGPDRTSIAWRKGRVITKIESHRGLDTMQVAGLVQRIIREDKPAKVNIDVGGLGAGVYDRLRETTTNRRIVNAVNFGGKPTEPPPLDERGQPAGGPANRRAELYQNLKSALEDGKFCLPDRDSLQGDLVSIGYKYDSGGRLLLEAKADMRRRGVPSPDEADAVALCFSERDGSGFVRDANFNRELIYRYQGAYV